MNCISNNSDGHYEADNCYDRKVTNEPCVSLKNKIKMICDKYGFN